VNHLYKSYTQGKTVKLFLDLVPSSSADDTREMRRYFRGRFLYVPFHFKAKENLQRYGDVRVNILGAFALML